MVFVDSNVWIGFLNSDDRHSKRANELFDKINQLPIIYVTSGIVHEVVNHLFKIKGKDAALFALKLFLSTPNIELFLLTEELWQAEINLFAHYTMNLTDAQIVAAMKENGETEIISFDAHFDQVEGIQRIY